MDDLERQKLMRLRDQLLAEKQRRAAAPRPTPEDLYSQEQEAVDNQPYLSPESEAQVQASLAGLRQPKPQPTQVPSPSAPPLAQGESAWWDPRPQNPTEAASMFMAGPVGPLIQRGVKAAVGKAQEVVGRPVAQGIYDALDAVEQSPVGSGQSITGTGTEYATKNILAPIGGEQFAAESTPASKAAFTGSLAQVPGVGHDFFLSPSPQTATGIAEGALQGIIPAAIGNAVGAEHAVTKAAAKFIPNAPIISRLLGYAAEGGLAGGIEGLLIKSQDPLTSAAVGAAGDVVVRGAVDGLVKGVKAGVKGAQKLFSKAGKAAATEAAPQVIGVVTKEGQEKLSEEIVSLLDSQPAKSVGTVDMATGQPRVEAPSIGEGPTLKRLEPPLPAEVATAERAVANVKSPEELRPFTVVARLNAEGKPVASVIEVSRGATPKVADVDLSTAESREKLFKYLFKNDISSVNTPREVMADPKFRTFLQELQTHEMQMATIKSPPQNVWYGASTAHVSKEGVSPVVVREMMNDARAKAGEELLPSLTPAGTTSKNFAAKGRETGTLDLPPNPDLPDGPLPSEGAVIRERPDGSLKLDPTFRPLRTDLVPQEAMAAAAEPPGGGNLGPPPPPQPPPPPGPGDIPPNQGEEIASVLVGAEKFSRQPTLFEKAIKGLVGGHMRGPKDAAQLIAMQRGQKALEVTSKEIANRFKKLVPRQVYPQMGRDVLKFAEGNLDSQVLHKKYPQVWDKIQDEVNALLQERDLNHQILRDVYGVVPDAIADEEGKIQKYVARRYMAHLMEPGAWAKYVRKHRPELMEEAVKYLIKDLPEGWSPDNVAAELVKIMKATDPLDSYRGSAFARTKAAKALMKRNEIAEPIRKLLGEVDNGFFRIAESLGSQRALISNLAMWREITANPQMFSRTPVAGVHHPEPLPNNRRLFGDAAGGYVTPHLYEELATVPKLIEAGPRWLRALVRWGKFNEVAAGGMTPWINATWGNLIQYSTYAGGLDIGRPREAYRGFLGARRDLMQYLKTASNDFVLEAKKYGVDGPGFGELEISDGRRGVDELLGELTPDGPGTMIDAVEAMGKGLLKGARKGKDWLSFQYDLIDRTFKLANYRIIRDRNLVKGMDPEQARRLAAYRVNQSFPAPDKIGRKVQELVQGPAGLVARYGTFFAEDLRIQLSLAKRLMEEPDLRARMLKMAIFGGALWGAGGLARRELGGISDEEIEKVEAAQSEGKQWYNPLIWYMPFRDSNGKPQGINLTNTIPLGRLFQGHPDDAMYKKVLANLIVGPTAEGGLAEEKLRQGLEAAGLARAPRQMPDQFANEPKVLQTMKTLWDVGIAPKGPERLYEALRRGQAFGPTGPYTEPYAPETAFTKAAGLPVTGGMSPSPQGPSAQQSKVEAFMQFKEMKSALMRAAKEDPERSVPFLKKMYQLATGETNETMRKAKMELIKATMKHIMEKQRQRQQTLGGNK